MESHLLQMRGLKLIGSRPLAALRKSHLLQMRGLKLFGRRAEMEGTEVASFTDAWIETIIEETPERKP